MEELNNILKNLRFDTYHLYFATNTIGFQFFDNNKTIVNRLIINPHWRIFRKNKFVISSLDCPWHEDYENQQDYINDFNLWCDCAKYLLDLKINDINIINELGDLKILWSDNSQLQTFISYDKEEYWYLESEIDLKRYVVETGKVLIEKIEKD